MHNIALFFGQGKKNSNLMPNKKFYSSEEKRMQPCLIFALLFRAGTKK